MLIKNVNLILQHSIEKGSLLIENSKIKKIFLNNVTISDNKVLDGDGLYLSPGFIDIHIHGSNGKDTMDGKTDSLVTIGKTLLKHGVTSFLPTTMTCSPTDINNALSAISTAKNNKLTPNNILGTHLEGPFINGNKIGAQNPVFLQNPTVAKFKEICGNFENIIKIVTLAPELQGAKELIDYLKNKNITVSIGHTDATYEETIKSIDDGISHATHLFNAMTPFNHRNPGCTGGVLNSNITAECILDGIHIHYAALEIALKIKSTDNIVLITDAMMACCMKDGKYSLGGQDVFVKNGEARLTSGTLAGSVLTLDKAVRNVKNNLNIPLNELIKLVTLNPAKVIKENHRKGLIAEGYDADLILFDEDINIKTVIVNGEIKEH